MPAEARGEGRAARLTGRQGLELAPGRRVPTRAGVVLAVGAGKDLVRFWPSNPPAQAAASAPLGDPGAKCRALTC